MKDTKQKQKTKNLPQNVIIDQSHISESSVISPGAVKYKFFWYILATLSSSIFEIAPKALVKEGNH